MNKLPGAANAVALKQVLSTIHSEFSKMKTHSEDTKVQKPLHFRKDSNALAHEAVACSDADQISKELFLFLVKPNTSTVRKRDLVRMFKRNGILTTDLRCSEFFDKLQDYPNDLPLSSLDELVKGE